MDYFLFNFSGVQFHYTMSPHKKNSTHAKRAWVLDFLMELLTGFEPATY